MIWLYIAAAVFGGAFVVPMLLGGLDFDTDADLDFDVDADVDVGTDLDLADAADTGSLGEFVGSLLSFRSIVMASLFFGIAGILLTVLDTNTALTLIAAIALGLFAASTNAAVMRYVLGNEQSSHVTAADVNGSLATVVLPMGDGRKGRVRAEIAGQTEYFTALPHRSDRPELGIGDEVIIVEVQNGTALVTPVQRLDPGS